MKSNEYQCGICHGVFEKGWSDEEAAADELNCRRWYRCLWDSTVVLAENCSGGSCPHCERKIAAKDHGVVMFRQFIVTEVLCERGWRRHSMVNLNISPVSEKDDGRV